MKTRMHPKSHRRGNAARSTRGNVQNEETGRNRLVTRALYDTETEEVSENSHSPVYFLYCKLYLGV